MDLKSLLSFFLPEKQLPICLSAMQERLFCYFFFSFQSADFLFNISLLFFSLLLKISWGYNHLFFLTKYFSCSYTTHALWYLRKLGIFFSTSPFSLRYS